MQYQKNNLFLYFLLFVTFLVINPFNLLLAIELQIDSNEVNNTVNNIIYKSNDLNKLDEKNNGILFNQFEFGLNNRITNFKQILNFTKFESTNRQNIDFNNYTSTIIIPEIYAKYNFNKYIGLSLGLSYLNFDYEDNLLESYPVSQNGDPIIAIINTKTLAKINSFALNQNLFFNYDNLSVNAGLGVFFCLHLI